MPAVARITWHNNFAVSLLLFSSDSVTDAELNRKNHHLKTNQQHLICPVIFTTHELKLVIIDSLQNILYAVCLYGTY